jgi:hypothetical protein
MRDSPLETGLVRVKTACCSSAWTLPYTVNGSILQRNHASPDANHFKGKTNGQNPPASRRYRGGFG